MQLVMKVKEIFKISKYQLLLLLLMVVTFGLQAQIDTWLYLLSVLVLMYCYSFLYQQKTIKGIIFTNSCLLLTYFAYAYGHSNYIVEYFLMELLFVWGLVYLIKYFKNPDEQHLVNHFTLGWQQILRAFGLSMVLWIGCKFLEFFTYLLGLTAIQNLYNWRDGFCFALFWLVISKFKFPGEEKVSSLYKVLFNWILPILTVITGLMAITYLVQSYFGYQPIIHFAREYYPFLIVYYLFYLCGLRGNTPKLLGKVNLLIFIIIGAMAVVYIITRQINYPQQQLGFVYSLLCNAIFTIYNLYLLVKGKGITNGFWAMVLALGLVVFMPVVGYFSYVEICEVNPQQKYNLSYALSLSKESMYDDHRDIKGNSKGEYLSLHYETQGIKIPQGATTFYKDLSCNFGATSSNTSDQQYKFTKQGDKLLVEHEGQVEEVNIIKIAEGNTEQKLIIPVKNGTIVVESLYYIKGEGEHGESTIDSIHFSFFGNN